jgi:hypothetical protein
VTTTYWDMAGEQYASRWRLNPFVYESRRYARHTGMGDLVEAVEGLSDDAKKISESIDRLASRPGVELDDGPRRQAQKGISPKERWAIRRI